MAEVNFVGETSCGIENPEGDPSVLVGMKKEFSNIDTVVSDNFVEEASCSAECPEGDSSVLIGTKKEISNINTVVSYNSEGEASCGVKNLEGDFWGLDWMIDDISRINTMISGEPTNSIDASFFFDCHTVKEVHIGPHDFNRGKQLKLQCFAHLIKQSKKDLKEYWNGMHPLEQEVRKCYANKECLSCKCDIYDHSSDRFLKMMILDGCFILEFFRFQFFILQQHKAIIKDHPIAQLERRKLPIIFQDLLQNGNQIPYMVLEGLFKICYPLFLGEGDNIFVKEREGDNIFVKERLLNIIGAVSLEALGVGNNYVKRFSSDPECFGRDFGFGGLQPVHLLDLIRLCFNSPRLVEQNTPGDLPQWNITLHGDNIPCISKLSLAGIKVNQQNGHYLEVSFRANAIKMPRIVLNELMCSFLHNSLNFEHQYKGASKHISTYVLLLDCLVDTADDIGYLRQRRVLEHHKKTDIEAADFINYLGKNINFDHIDSNFFELCRDVNRYYLSESRMKWESFKREYFDKPWLLISIFAGLVLLILSCLQTYYTMRPYLYPQN